MRPPRCAPLPSVGAAVGEGEAPTLPCWENLCFAKFLPRKPLPVLLLVCVWVPVGDLAHSPARAGTQPSAAPGSMSHVLLQLPRGLSLPTLDPTLVFWLMCDPLALLELFKAASSGLLSPWRCCLPSSDCDKELRGSRWGHLDLLEPRGKTFH